MDRSTLTDQLSGLPDRLRGGDDDTDDSKKGETDDEDGLLPDVDVPDPRLTGDSDSRLSLGLVVLTLLGLLVAAVAIVYRFLLGDSDGTSERETPDPSEDSTAGEGVGDSETETDEAGTTDETGGNADEVGVETTALAAEADTEEAATSKSDIAAEGDGPSATEQILGSRADREDEGPRIAPVVGMAAQVGFQQFVEKFRPEDDESDQQATE